MEGKMRVNKNTTSLIVSAFMVALITVCSWTSINFIVPVTLQTFAVFLTALILDMRYSFLSLFSYILLGICGVPVFAGFKSGVGVIFSATGGYIIGFIFIILSVQASKKFFGGTRIANTLSMLVGLLLCYLCGTLWFMTVYARGTGEIGFFSVVSMCVLPFIIPDICKMLLALFVADRIKKSKVLDALN